MEYYQDEEYLENEPNTDCVKCGRHYDDIDYDYQCCSKCGWDEEKKEWIKAREPQQSDYLNGEADILTGRWN